MSRDERHQEGASAHSVLVSSLVLRRPAQAKSTEASGKGCHIGATRPRPGGRQGGGHRGAQDGVTTRAFAGEHRFCQDSLYKMSPFKFARRCWLPSRSIFGKRTRAYISRASHHSRGIESSRHKFIRTRTPQPQEAVLPLYCSSSTQEAIHHRHTGVGYYTTTVARTSINPVSLCVASSSSSSARS